MLFEHLVWLLVFQLIQGRRFGGANQYYFSFAEFSSHFCMCHLPELNVKIKNTLEQENQHNSETKNLHMPPKVTHTKKGFPSVSQKRTYRGLPRFHLVVRIEGYYPLASFFQCLDSFQEFPLHRLLFSSDDLRTLPVDV